MHRRLIVIAMLLATVFQGPALTYAATLGSGSITDAITHACGGQTLPAGADCDTCCSHGAMAACAAQCLVPVVAMVPLTFPTVLRIAACGTVIPDFVIAPFADHDPPHPLRPPIV